MPKRKSKSKSSSSRRQQRELFPIPKNSILGSFIDSSASSIGSPSPNSPPPAQAQEQEHEHELSTPNKINQPGIVLTPVPHVDMIHMIGSVRSSEKFQALDSLGSDSLESTPIEVRKEHVKRAKWNQPKPNFWKSQTQYAAEAMAANSSTMVPSTMVSSIGNLVNLKYLYLYSNSFNGNFLRIHTATVHLQFI